MIEKFYNHVINIFKNNEKDDRVIEPLFNTLAHLLTKSYFIDSKYLEFTDLIHKSIGKENYESKNIHKILASVDIYYNLLLLAKEEKVNLTQDEYYNYILQLKIHNEKEILLKVLTQNKNIYPLEEDEFGWLRGEIPSLKGKKNLTPFENYLYKFAEEECIEELEHLDFDVWKIFEKESYNFNSQKYKQRVLNADDYIKKLSPCSSTAKAKEGKTVVAWLYYNIHSLKSGDKFGDMALTSTTRKRTATIISESECHFGILEKNSFIKCLKNVSDRAKVKNINYILSQKVFSDININIFQKNYFNQFVNKKLSIGEFLISEGQLADKIFVIKEGDFEVTVKASNMELCRLIRKLGDDSAKLPHEFDLINGIRLKQLLVLFYIVFFLIVNKRIFIEI